MGLIWIQTVHFRRFENCVHKPAGRAFLEVAQLPTGGKANRFLVAQAALV
jgi:hypothetical protein